MVERSFRTDEEEFFFWLEEAPRDHLELNAWYQRFLDTYNSLTPSHGHQYAYSQGGYRPVP